MRRSPQQGYASLGSAEQVDRLRAATWLDGENVEECDVPRPVPWVGRWLRRTRIPTGG